VIAVVHVVIATRAHNHCHCHCYYVRSRFVGLTNVQLVLGRMSILRQLGLHSRCGQPHRTLCSSDIHELPSYLLSRRVKTYNMWLDRVRQRKRSAPERHIPNANIYIYIYIIGRP